jgi:hypothetical protein
MASGSCDVRGNGMRPSRRVVLALFAIAGVVGPGIALAQADTEIRYMNLSDITVAGRRLLLADRTLMSLYKNGTYVVAGPTHDAPAQGGGKRQTRGKWEIQYGNTLYVVMEDGSSRSWVFFKIGEKLFMRTVTGATPNFGEQILQIAALE